MGQDVVGCQPWAFVSEQLSRTPPRCDLDNLGFRMALEKPDQLGTGVAGGSHDGNAHG